MRKLFWCGVLAAVAAAGGVYLSASHASRHPESVIGRAAIGAYRGLEWMHPAHAVGQLMTGRGCESSTTGAGCGAVVSCAAIEMVVAEECAETPSCPPLDLGQCRLPGRIIINEQEEARQVAEWPLTGAVIELVPAPRMIDEAIEEDVEPIRSTGVVVPPPPPLPELFLQTEEPLMPPADDSAPAIMPPAQEEPSSVTDPLESLRKFSRKPDVPAESKQDEESEQPDYGRSPECREDPHHSQLYPGCPHSICPQSRNYCPYSGRPIAVAPQTPAMPERLEKKADRPASPRFLDEAEESEERTGSRGVDTMEFRSDDARPEEFGLIPF
jgi:hypothetical protein